MINPISKEAFPRKVMAGFGIGYWDLRFICNLVLVIYSISINIPIAYDFCLLSELFIPTRADRHGISFQLG